jgi:hypothetical protein
MARLLSVVVCALVLSLYASAQNDITKIDFKNFTYPALCVGEVSENLTVKDGEYLKETQQDGYVDRLSLTIMDVAFGDVTGDGKPDAAIISSCNTGGTGNFSEGYVYSMVAGKPKLIARFPGGDRAYGGLRAVHIENGLLVVENNEAGELGGSCCPEFVVTTKYRVVAGKLVKSGAPIKRELVPTTRVTFARGTSGKTYNNVTIAAGEAIRYKVGARANQRLSVSVSSDSASLRLIEDANITNGVNNFVAVLPSNGDYTIEIENTAAADISITVNIKIN